MAERRHGDRQHASVGEGEAVKIDKIMEEIREGENLPPLNELRALCDYIAYLEFGYVGLQRTDMVDTAKANAARRIDDHKKSDD